MGPAELFMFEGHHHSISDLLASRGLVVPSALQAALEAHEATGESFVELLVARSLIDQAALLQAIAEHFGFDYADKLPVGLPEEILGTVERGIARLYGIVPVAADAMALTVLVSDPFNPNLIGDVRFALGRDVRFAVADPGRVQWFMQKYYGESEGSQERGQVRLPEPPGESIEAADPSEADLEKLAGQTPIIRFVNSVLAQTIREKASDIHFEPFARDFKIRYRIDGALCEMASPSRTLALPIISRLKVLANLNIAERRLPQDGRIKLKLEGRAVDLRVSTLPTQFGESVVLRVLDQSSGQLALDQVGLPGKILAGVENIIRRPNGIFIVTGPTGSGKTTTLYSCLKALNTIDAKLLSVEDPVEYEIDGVMQVPVNPAAGLTFARTLRSFLRQDPDIVMVGEIRDYETAQIAVQASLTGHLVLTTLHTNDAAGAVTRLVDMGIEPFLLASTLEGVLAQRLVRRICAACKVGFEPDEACLRQVSVDRAALNGRPFYCGVGCEECRQSGYRGRVGLFEFLRFSEMLRELVLQGASVVQLRQRALSEGMTTLRAAGVRAILAGETTVEEVIIYT